MHIHRKGKKKSTWLSLNLYEKETLAKPTDRQEQKKRVRNRTEYAATSAVTYSLYI